MEAKDLVLLMIMPILLVSIIFYTNNNQITGAVTAEEKDSNIIGTYSIMPSFKAKIDYSMDEYKNINEKLKSIIDECKSIQGIEACIKDRADKFGWNCAKNEETDVLYDFADKLKDCISLKEENVVCKFSFDERKYINEAKNKRIFEIKLTNWYNRIKAELTEDGKTLATEFVDLEKLSYISYSNKGTEGTNADSVLIKVNYEDGKPSVDEAYALTEKSSKIGLSRIFLLYKSKNDAKFIDSSEESSFRAPTPANKVINIPRTKGIKFCAKTGKQIYAYDNSDDIVKLRDIIYKFAVTFPSPPPKPVETLEVIDALKSENSVILSWDKGEEAGINSYSIYYSSKDFSDAAVDDIKKDKDINKKSISNTPTEIKDIDLRNCVIGPIGTLCRYSGYNKALEKDKLYLAKNKLIYIVTDVNDGTEYNFAVTAVNDEGEINNDKSNKENTYVLAIGKNYGRFVPVDDLAPDKVSELQVQSAENGKVKLSWKKPSKNIDGSAITDLAGFNIYYKKASLTLPPELVVIDSFFAKRRITAQEANCDSVGLSCEYTLEGLEKLQAYNFAVTALDDINNEFIEAKIVQHIIT